MRRRSCARRHVTLTPDAAERGARGRAACAAGPARHRAARAAEVLAADRAAGVGAGAAAAVAGGVRGRLSQRVRRRHRRALRHLHSLRRLHRAGPGRHGAAVQRHAVVAGDGLRPRDGPDAAAAHRAAAALRGCCSASCCATALLSVLQALAFVHRRRAARHRAAGVSQPSVLHALAGAGCAAR